MNIFISNSSNQPIYEQITNQVKALIMSGELKEGDLLPSMRLLAKELRISVITTKRAYEELEKDGFIVSRTGRGSFVASKNTDLLREEHLKKIERLLNDAVEESRKCNLQYDELVEMIDILYKSE